MARGLEHLSCKDRLRELGCSAWRRKACRETLQQPASTCRGLQEGWRGAFHKGV